MAAFAMRNIIKGVYNYSMGIKNFHVQGQGHSMVVKRRRPYSPYHRCFCMVSNPTPKTSIRRRPLGSLDGDSCGNILRYSFNAGNIQRIDAHNKLESEVIGEGEELLEVFSVRIIYCKNSVYLYGSIVYDDEVYLYNRQPSDSELVNQDDTLSLTGPHYCLELRDQFALQLNLKDKDGNLFPECEDFICWVFSERDELDDDRLITYFYSNSVTLAVYYTMFNDALQAKVEVEVVKVDDEDGANKVYGKVVARYSKYDYSTDEQKKYFQTVLFDKSENNYVKVEPGKHIIPLSRYAVAVPTTSYLIIEANLFDYDKHMKPNDQIAKGTILFSPRTEGVAVNDIHGDSILVRVTVTWNSANFVKQW